MSTTINKGVIRAINIAVGSIATIAALSQLTYLLVDFNVFAQTFFAIPLAALGVLLEFRVPAQLHKFASFYFSFLGRGLLYILLGIMVCHGGAFKMLSALLLVLAGISFCLFQFLPMVEEPDYFKLGNASLTVGDDEFDDDDEVI